MSTRSLGLALIVTTVLQAVAGAQTLYVDINGTAPGSGTPGDPYTSIQTAIDNAANNFVIEVAPGTYVEDLVLDVSGVLVRGTNGPTQTVLVSDGTGPNVVRIIRDFSGIEGLTVTGVDDGRTAVFITIGNVGYLTRCIIANNTGAGVSGAYDAVIQECTITSNDGPGIVTQGGFAFWTVSNSIVRGNGQKSSFIAAGGGISYSILQGESPKPTFGPGIINAKAELWSRTGADFYLKPGSPAIDAGNPASPLDPDGSVIDIGALTYDATHAPLEPETYCTSQINSQGCSPNVSTTGTPSLSAGAFSINCSNVLNNKSGLFFYGFGGKATPYQGGMLCVQAPVRRTLVQSSGGNAPPDDCSGSYSYDLGALLQSGSDPLLFVGQSVFGQYWYRDSQQAGPFTTGRSEGIGFQVSP